jgi:hypothetical protein
MGVRQAPELRAGVRCASLAAEFGDLLCLFLLSDIAQL